MRATPSRQENRSSAAVTNSSMFFSAGSNGSWRLRGCQSQDIMGGGGGDEGGDGGRVVRGGYGGWKTKEAA